MGALSDVTEPEFITDLCTCLCSLAHHPATVIHGQNPCVPLVDFVHS